MDSSQQPLVSHVDQTHQQIVNNIQTELQAATGQEHSVEPINEHHNLQATIDQHLEELSEKTKDTVEDLTDVSGGFLKDIKELFGFFVSRVRQTDSKKFLDAKMERLSEIHQASDIKLK